MSHRHHQAPAVAEQKPAALTSARGAKLLSIVFCVVALAFVVYTCAFKVLDRDFWWHIKAGEVMVQTHHVISIEPFAYTRAGQPYLATYEWLAQVILYLVHAAGGTNGIILFRTAMIALATLLILFIDRKRLWPNVFLLAYVITAARPGFMDRPQLFTFAILATFVWLSYRLIDDPEAGKEEGWSRGEKALWWFVPLEILWFNTHGAAALLGIGIVGAILAQRIVTRLFADTLYKRQASMRAALRVAAVCAVLGLSVFVSPTGLGNITYLNSLFHDKTALFINEWQPRAIGLYLKDYWLLWVISLTALFASRKNFTFSALVLFATGILSRQAFRHEMLFAFTATGVTIYQLAYLGFWTRTLEWLKARLVWFTLVTLLLFAATMWFAAERYRSFVAKDYLYGWGTFDLARGAYDYVEANHIEGHMFNTYGIGGYLLYRGYPERKVYIDGRNVDYGFDFMNNTYKAQRDPKAWQELEDKFGLTYAFIDYDAIKEWDNYPFSDHLDVNLHWKLVYLDDWVGLYLKDTKENAPIIARDAFTLVNPRNLTNGDVVDSAKELELPKLEHELQRVVDDNHDGYKGPLALAKLYRREKKYDLAHETLNPALEREPKRPDLHYELAHLLGEEGRWPEAAKEYDLTLDFSTNKPSPDVLKAAADAHEKAGDKKRADAYRTEVSSVPAAPPQIPSGLTNNDPASQAKVQELLKQLQTPDTGELSLAEQAIQEAEAGHLQKAESMFLEALKSEPHNADILNNLGVAYQQDHRLSDAETYYRKALVEKANYVDAEFNLATDLYAQRKFDDALTHAKKAGTLGRDVTALVAAIENAISKAK